MVNKRFIFLTITLIFAHVMNKQVENLNKFYFKHTVYLSSFYESLQMTMLVALGGRIFGLDGILTEENYVSTFVILLIIFLIIFVCVYSINDRRRAASFCLVQGQKDKAKMVLNTANLYEAILLLANFGFHFIFYQVLLFWLSK